MIIAGCIGRPANCRPHGWAYATGRLHLARLAPRASCRMCAGRRRHSPPSRLPRHPAADVRRLAHSSTRAPRSPGRRPSRKGGCPRRLRARPRHGRCGRSCPRSRPAARPHSPNGCCSCRGTIRPACLLGAGAFQPLAHRRRHGHCNRASPAPRRVRTDRDRVPRRAGRAQRCAPRRPLPALDRAAPHDGRRQPNMTSAANPMTRHARSRRPGCGRS